MRKTTAAVLLAIAITSAAGERPGLRGGESPRATDLLRAEALAEGARKRLALPRPASAGWKRAGSWGAGRGAQRSGAPPVTIRVAPPRARRRAQG